MDQVKRISIITGHYGSGKTNIAVNFALDLKSKGYPVTIVDLDIVNPYFRTADYKALLEQHGIRVIAPLYAGTNLDIPALPGEINSIFDDRSHCVILDVGGDDAGAIALGRYARRIEESGYDMYYVINARRYLTSNAEDAAALLTEIETASRLKATKLINNTNLGNQTDLNTVTDSYPFAQEVSRLTGLAIAYTCVDKDIAKNNPDFYPVEIYVTNT